MNDIENPKVGTRVFERFKGGSEGTLAYYQALAEMIQKRNATVTSQLEVSVANMHALAGASQRIALC